MNSTNPETSGEENALEVSADTSEATKINPPKTSATTEDEPSFGWSGYAERVNGRFAMIGFIAILLIEAVSQSSFLKWAGLLN